jgi:hypothetical protein
MTSFRVSFFRLWFVAASLGLLLARPAPAWACSCIMPGSPADAFNQADAVFVGTVTGVRNAAPPDWLFPILQRVPGYEFPMDNTRVSFQVMNAWKGLTENSVVVRTGQGDADCGFTFAPGGQYLVYTFEHEGEQFTNICSRTSDVAYATEDLNYLNTQTPLALSPSAGASPWPVAAGAGLLALALAVLGGMAWLGRGRA